MDETTETTETSKFTTAKNAASAAVLIATTIVAARVLWNTVGHEFKVEFESRRAKKIAESEE